MNTTPEGELAPRKSWWGRNWLWVLPTGCLGLLLSCGCLGAVFFGVLMKGMSSSDVFTQAVTRARQSPEVVQALGEPISTKWNIQGSMQNGTQGGSAHFTIPLQGPKAEGTLRVDATKGEADKEWTYSTLRVDVPDHPQIDLLGAGGTPSPRDTARPQDTLPQVEPLPDDTTEPADEPETGSGTGPGTRQQQAPPPAHRPHPGKNKGKKNKDDVEL